MNAKSGLRIIYFECNIGSGRTSRVQSLKHVDHSRPESPRSLKINLKYTELKFMTFQRSNGCCQYRRRNKTSVFGNDREKLVSCNFDHKKGFSSRNFE